MADEDPTVSGTFPIGAGAGSIVRIPVPGPDNLVISLSTNDPAWKGRSSSSIFIQDPTGKKFVRLDFGKNKNFNDAVNYHWNQQKGLAARFGVTNHQPVGAAGKFLDKSARAYKVAGRTFLVLGVAIDGYSIYQASKPMQRATEVVTAWAGAWLGCKVVGAGGAAGGGALGTAVPVIGNAVGAAGGGLIGCIVGGVGGYIAGEKVGRVVYQWADDTKFTLVQQDLSYLPAR